MDLENLYLRLILGAKSSLPLYPGKAFQTPGQKLTPRPDVGRLAGVSLRDSTAPKGKP